MSSAADSGAVSRKPMRGPSKLPRQIKRLVSEAIEGAQAAGREVTRIEFGNVAVILSEPSLETEALGNWGLPNA